MVRRLWPCKERVKSGEAKTLESGSSMEVREGENRRPVETGGATRDQSPAGNNVLMCGKTETLAAGKMPEVWPTETLRREATPESLAAEHRRRSRGKREKSPNDPNLSDGGAWRGACPRVRRTKRALP